MTTAGVLRSRGSQPERVRPRGRPSVQDNDGFEQVVELELALLHPDLRRDRQWVEELLDEDFREIGASGCVWTRRETVEMLAAEQTDGAIAVVDMEALQLADGVVLLTYVSDRAGRRARRSAIWRRVDGRWRVLHHQGTLAPEGMARPGLGSPPDAD
jgi:hypothetical protein